MAVQIEMLKHHANILPDAVEICTDSSDVLLIDPELGSSSLLQQRSSVLLPDPDGPIIKTNCPFMTSKSMPLSTSLSPKDL
jgi:hypothetical protein